MVGDTRHSTRVLIGLVIALAVASACGDDASSNPGAKDIVEFTILDVDGAINGASIALTLPYGTDPTSLTPTISITGRSVSPSSGVVQDFTSPVIYTVTAADGTTKGYSVTVAIATLGAKDITHFTILGVNGVIAGTSIAITLPFGTDPSQLLPTISITGASVSPASGVVQDFTAPVTYTVTAADGTTKDYIATVSIAASGAKDITQFTILGIAGAINGTSISLTLPFGTDRTSLTPTITITGSGVAPASGAPRDFTNPVTYTVTAADGTTKIYTVTASVALNSAKDITRFAILGVDGVISGTNIGLTVPFGTDPTSLTPTIEITGASVSPGNGAPRNFSAPVMYTVTAADGTTQVYAVTVTVALNDAKDIVQFYVDGVNGTINGADIAVTVPYGTDPTSITPLISITGTSINPASGVPRDFTNPVMYTVTAADGTTKIYTVTVAVAANNEKGITQFTILGFNAEHELANLSIIVPHGTDVTSLTPTIAITGVSVNPASGVPTNFTNPVMYTVTAADSTTSVYTVTVTVGVRPPSFAARVDFPIGSNPSTPVVGDLNTDGKLDLAVVRRGTMFGFSIFLNTTPLGATSPSLSARVDVATPSRPSKLAQADVNADGKPDLVVTHGLSDSVSVFLNTTLAGATVPSLDAPVEFTTGDQPVGVAVGDLNGDGKPDLAIANYGAATTSVLLNTTATGANTPSFATKVDLAVGNVPVAATIGDLNADGKPDLVVVNQGTTVSILFNNTPVGANTPSFASAVTLQVYQQNLVSAALADLNADGKPDLAIANQQSNSMSVFMNLTPPGATTPSFTTPKAVASGNAPNDVAFADLNLDGKPDAVLPVYFDNVVTIHSGMTAAGAAKATFAPRSTAQTASAPNSIAIGDLNGDAKPDVITANNLGGSISILINTTP